MSSAISSSGRSKFLTLYRNILQLHRSKLPREMRMLGDMYVRDEFRRFQETELSKEKHWPEFETQWTQYLDQVRSDFGSNSSGIENYSGMKKEEVNDAGMTENEEALVELLNDEQKGKLIQLRYQAACVGEQKGD